MTTTDRDDETRDEATPPVSLRLEHPVSQPALTGLQGEHPVAETRPTDLRVERPASELRPTGLRVERPASEPRPTSLRVERPASEPRPTPLRLDRPASQPAPEAKAAPKPAAGPRLPRLCLMGEFSAGKSTLTNLLIGAPALPVNVTATQLPPVWIRYGTDAPYRVDLDGNEYDIDLNRLAEISVDDTSHICIFREAELLQRCELIDMPGISDPNMAPVVWQRVISKANMVIWCTHATQAWRQSEAAVWAMLPSELRSKSFLLLTRIDKILSDRDRLRVLKRVGRETHGLFRDIFPISLVDAMEAGDDEEAWRNSGAASFWAALGEAIGEFGGERPKTRMLSPSRPVSQAAPIDEPEPVAPKVVMPTRVQPRPLTSRPMPSRASRLMNGDAHLG